MPPRHVCRPPEPVSAGREWACPVCGEVWYVADVSFGEDPALEWCTE